MHPPESTDILSPPPLSPSILPCCAQRLLDYIRPDFVHIMQSGQIVKTGDITLVDQLELSGYSILEPARAAL